MIGQPTRGGSLRCVRDEIDAEAVGATDFAYQFGLSVTVVRHLQLDPLLPAELIPHGMAGAGAAQRLPTASTDVFKHRPEEHRLPLTRAGLELLILVHHGCRVNRSSSRSSATEALAAGLVAHQHPTWLRGLRQLGAALNLVDAGAESPRETALRLLLIGAGYPRPRTQIPVIGADGRRQYYLDMGWEGPMLAVGDGDLPSACLARLRSARMR